VLSGTPIKEQHENNRCSTKYPESKSHKNLIHMFIHFEMGFKKACKNRPMHVFSQKEKI
jgi:hypothetical protein